VFPYKISHSKPGSVEVSNLGKCQPLIGSWSSDGAYHYMLLPLIYLLLQRKLQSVLNFGQNVSWRSYLLIY